MAITPMDFSTLTLSQLMAHKSNRVRRQAIAIFKMLPEELEKLGKAYMQDAMTRANDFDRAQEATRRMTADEYKMANDKGHFIKCQCPDCE